MIMTIIILIFISIRVASPSSTSPHDNDRYVSSCCTDITIDTIV